MESPFPMRINKYLAEQGHATRRGADELIARGRVFINGKPAELGSKVMEEDIVEVKFGKRAKKQEYRYYAYNKPRGIITHSPKEGEEDVRDTLPQLADEGVFPVGRLDKDSHGLLIVTNDGRITDRLLNPEREHDKEYVVRTKAPLRKNFKERMEAGVSIEGYVTKPARVRITGDRSFTVTLTEGKKHQIRRMVVALWNEVDDLKRTRVMNIKLGNIKAGQARPIEGEELDEFLVLLGLKQA
ncbi:MAG TPA: pseudouridine synthase [Candidatus Paceibacterota bacterium]|jgi:23S rRNA pseudouridine2604 synthase